MKDMAPEFQELLQSLTHTTARLARLQREGCQELERGLVERSRAIEALQRHIAEQPEASASASAELASQLTREMDSGTQVLLRLALAREVLRSDRMVLDRQLQVLRGIQSSPLAARNSISCRG
jgi:hypothetical protein